MVVFLGEKKIEKKKAPGFHLMEKEMFVIHSAKVNGIYGEKHVSQNIGRTVFIAPTPLGMNIYVAIFHSISRWRRFVAGEKAFLLARV